MKEKNTNKMLGEIIKKIKPSRKELNEEQEIVKKLIKKIKETEGKHVGVELAGSIARNTHLRGDRDIDLFVMFPKQLSREEFVREGLRIGKRVLKGFEWEEAYSEHPYIRGEMHGFEVEIVPSYKIKSTAELKSSVDRTPFHNAYLQKKLKTKQKDEVRLLRQFLKGIECYGSDIRAESFPGYLVELIIVEYNSFLKALENVAKWKKGKIIDLARFYKNEEEAKKKFPHHLVVVDPTDKNRNVAAALSFNQFSRFIAASRAFLNKPSKNFFFGKKKKALNKGKMNGLLKKRELLAVEIAYPKNLLADIAWGQLRRLKRKLAGQLEQKEFKTIRSTDWTDEKSIMVILIELERLKIPEIEKRIGPEVIDESNSEKFLKANKKILSGPRIEEGRWVIERIRANTNAANFLKEYLKKTKKESKPLMKRALKKKCNVLEKEKISRLCKNKEFAVFLSDYLQGEEKFLE